MSEKRPDCEARRVNDEYQCGACGLTWDARDPDPPKCAPAPKRRRKRGPGRTVRRRAP